MSADEGIELAVDMDAPVDPDPFTLGLGLFGAIAGGGAFLETRRHRQYAQSQGRDAFRGAWFKARRTLIHFKGQIDEFETYMLEEGFGRKAFRIGAVRLEVDRGRHKSLRRLRGQIYVTASHMGDDLDDLSEYLTTDYQERRCHSHAARRARASVALPGFDRFSAGVLPALHGPFGCNSRQGRL